jgi:hypothetical protein
LPPRLRRHWRLLGPAVKATKAMSLERIVMDVLHRLDMLQQAVDEGTRH